MLPPSRLAGEGSVMSESEFREREVLIERYRHLQREVTDPMATALLRWIVLELEHELRREVIHERVAPAVP